MLLEVIFQEQLLQAWKRYPYKPPLQVQASPTVLHCLVRNFPKIRCQEVYQGGKRESGKTRKSHCGDLDHQALKVQLGSSVNVLHLQRIRVVARGGGRKNDEGDAGGEGTEMWKRMVYESVLRDLASNTHTPLIYDVDENPD